MSQLHQNALSGAALADSTTNATESSLSEDYIAQMKFLACKPCKIHLISYLETGAADSSKRARQALYEAKMAGAYCYDCYDTISQQAITIQNMQWEMERLEAQVELAGYKQRESQTQQPEHAEANEKLRRLNAWLRQELVKYAYDGDYKAAQADARLRVAMREIEDQAMRINQLEQEVLSAREDARTLRERLIMQNAWPAQQSHVEVQNGSRVAKTHIKTELQRIKGQLFTLRSSIQAARIFATTFSASSTYMLDTALPNRNGQKHK